MNILFKLYKRFTYTDWQIVFADNKLEEIVNGSQLQLHVMRHSYKDRWFADPFILDITNDEIRLLVECVTDDTRKGRIALLNVDRKTYSLKDMQFILDLPTHLSFPFIMRKNGRIYVYPENGDSGKLNKYEFDLENKVFVFQNTIISKALGDAIITEAFGCPLLFATEQPDMNGCNLSIYKKNNNNSWVIDQYVCFDEHVARMAGDFFKIGDKIYRPAQECNESYGHGLVIQQVTPPSESNNMKWQFKEICRMTSPLNRYPLCLHTLNSFKDIIVMDVKGYRYYKIGTFLNKFKSRFFGKYRLEH